mmetsp:Transcript_2368/g.4286  ORF Transcript_2368/g.4286 Transcript_2368/m.4286 type:complete len:215 (+) Transcript_2368:717-1361(+)
MTFFATSLSAFCRTFVLPVPTFVDLSVEILSQLALPFSSLWLPVISRCWLPAIPGLSAPISRLSLPAFAVSIATPRGTAISACQDFGHSPQFIIRVSSSSIAFGFALRAGLALAPVPERKGSALFAVNFSTFASWRAPVPSIMTAMSVIPAFTLIPVFSTCIPVFLPSPCRLVAPRWAFPSILPLGFAAAPHGAKLGTLRCDTHPLTALLTPKA